MSLALSKVEHLTILQSEDPGWFLARAFRFTSRTTQVFLTTFASDYEMHIKGLACILRDRRVISGSDPLPADVGEAEQVLRGKWEAVFTTLNMQCRTSPSQNTTAASVTQLINGTTESLSALRKEDLLSLIASVGHRQSAALRKQQLVSKILEIQEEVRDGTLDIGTERVDTVSDEERDAERKKKLTNRLYSASLSAWFMKPLVSTAGMKEGSVNEHQVLQSLPFFIDKNRCWSEDEFIPQRAARESIARKHRVEYICTTGLVGSHNISLLAGSPDGVAAISNQDGDVFVSAVEIKTMTAIRTIESATRIQLSYSQYVYVRRIGQCHNSLKVFHDMVPSTSYRVQCLHHSAVLGIQHVLFAVAKGSSMGVGEIIYCVLLEFSESIIACYNYCLSGICKGFFGWIGMNARSIPSVYEGLLADTYAADLYSFASFYNLSEAYKELSLTRGPLPPARMIRPSGLVFWNLVKGGVDEFSRALKSLCYHNSSENPIVSILGRLLCAQVSNAAIVHWFSIAKARGMLEKFEKDGAIEAGYSSLRHDVARCASFSSFARMLAKEYTDSLQRETDNTSGSTTKVTGGVEYMPVTPMYIKNAASKYNRPADKERRLSDYNEHKKMKGKGAYCSLCPFNYSFRADGKVYRKKGGSRMRQWCSVCCQPICMTCWEPWHTNDILTRATISPEDLRKLRAKAQQQSQDE